MMLKFATFTSEIEFPFWASLASRKVDQDRLDDSSQRLLGVYGFQPSNIPGTNCRIEVHGDAFNRRDPSSVEYLAEGTIKNVNTVEEFRDLDKTAILSDTGSKILVAIDNGDILSNPSLLVSFVIISFADIKRYKFTYLVGFPALHSQYLWGISLNGERPHNQNPSTTDEVVWSQRQQLDSDESEHLLKSLEQWRMSTAANQRGFFLARRHRGTGSTTSPISGLARSSWLVQSLAEYEAGFFDQVPEEDRFFGFADPSTFPEAPAWLLRNFLMLLSRRWKLQRAQLLVCRDGANSSLSLKPLVLPVEMLPTPSDRVVNIEDAEIKTTGWERNQSGKIVSRTVNAAEYLDPKRLANQAIDLNLKLMRWRIAPNLDLEKIQNTSCLLLGAGTLGCYVARSLMAWGVRTITFVDSGNISYSNPVRQPLYRQSDCLNGGLPKAYRAAEALREIHPGIKTKGHSFSIPMAGHPIVNEAESVSAFKATQQLISQHDAVFLLTDSRESRWLPTLIGKFHKKIVMNAALGFDSYVAMRHGVHNPNERHQELGCYFCNDVVAPIDSLSERTLDQQCTVTRPGVAAIASGLLVEIFVNLLQHPLGVLAPATALPSTSETPDNQIESDLGVVPHQVRGVLSSFETLKIEGRAYVNCSACSDRILSAYAKDPWGFVKSALNEEGIVEEISGLAEVQRAGEQALIDLEAMNEFNESTDDELGSPVARS